MLLLNNLSTTDFLKYYWQKKPLIIRQALPDRRKLLTAEELAGLSMEDDCESRLVFETPDRTPQWTVKHGPFTEKDFSDLPESHWTLLVQAVDRFIPEISALLDHFNFLPQWRVDDIMISFAAMAGSVGPHYDNYDVFLYQAEGRRKWSLTTIDCHEDNYLTDVPLRIMKNFQTEEEIILEEGDMLYLPPHVGHHGVSLSDDCMTFSFGYRSYQGQEIWDSFGEFLASQKKSAILYKDPSWIPTEHSSEIPEQAWINAKETMLALINDERLMKDWFGRFATSLDSHAEIMVPHETEDGADFPMFVSMLRNSTGLFRNLVCRFAYCEHETAPALTLFVNGEKWDTEKVTPELVKVIANNRMVLNSMFQPYLDNEDNQRFLFELFSRAWLELVE